VAWWLRVGSRLTERERVRERERRERGVGAQRMGLTVSGSVGIGALLRAEAQVV
jgi:hypothetical protein